QRDGPSGIQAVVHKVRAATAGAQHLRAALEPGPDPDLLAVAAAGRGDLGHSGAGGARGDVHDLRRRLAAGAGGDVPDQSLRPLRAAAGVAVPPRPEVHAADIPHTDSVPACAASAVSGLAD